MSNKCPICSGKMKRRKIRIAWTCSDFVHHEHRYKFMAYLCGNIQYIIYKIKESIRGIK